MSNPTTELKSEPMVKVHVTSAGGDVVVRQGAALPVREPECVRITGTITAPADYLAARKEVLPVELQLRSHVLVDSTAGKITLVIDESNPYRTVIVGTLEPSDESKVLPINTGKALNPLALSDLIKANRYLFASRDEAMQLVSKLRDAKTKIDAVVERSKDDRANYAMVKRQAIQTTIPESFSLRIPITRGGGPMLINVEIAIHPDTLDCTLISPELTEAVRDDRERSISYEIESIAKEARNVVLIHV